MNPILIVLIFSLVWLIIRWRYREFVRLAYQLPSNRLQTWIGWGPIYTSKEIQDSFCKHAEKYGPVSICWTGPIPILLLSKPEILEEILTAKNCINKPRLIYAGLEIVLGTNLVSISEPDWSRHRKVFNKAFSNTNIMAFTPILRNEVINTVNIIRDNLKSGTTFDVLSLCQALTVKTSLKTMLKSDIKDIAFEIDDIVDKTSRTQAYVAERCFNHLLKVKFISYLAEMTIYRKCIKEIELVNKYFFDAMMKTKNLPVDILTPVDIGFAAEKRDILKLKEIKDDLMSLYAGAFETSSFALYTVIFLLAMHHECQQRLYEEVLSLWPDLTDNDGKITFEQVNRMVYLDMVINESMRVLPPIPLVFRTVANENLKLSTGEILPVGLIIAIDIYKTHRNKDIWGPKADYFNPENFSPSSVEQRHPYAFLPFTKGQRNCIGYRYSLLFLKMSLAELIKNFKFDTDFKYEDLKVHNHISLKLSENPKLRVEERVPKTFQMRQ